MKFYEIYVQKGSTTSLLEDVLYIELFVSNNYVK